MSQDKDAIDEIAATTDITRPQRILHYLYFARREDAQPVIRSLQGQGFHVEDSLGALGTNWLVLATHQLVLTKDSMAAVRRSMESLAARYGGEYDGWEAQLSETT